MSLERSELRLFRRRAQERAAERRAPEWIGRPLRLGTLSDGRASFPWDVDESVRAFGVIVGFHALDAKGGAWVDLPLSIGGASGEGSGWLRARGSRRRGGSSGKHRCRGAVRVALHSRHRSPPAAHRSLAEGDDSWDPAPRGFEPVTPRTSPVLLRPRGHFIGYQIEERPFTPKSAHCHGSVILLAPLADRSRRSQNCFFKLTPRVRGLPRKAAKVWVEPGPVPDPWRGASKATCI